jgi:hypothetical protein
LICLNECQRCRPHYPSAEDAESAAELSVLAAAKDTAGRCHDFAAGQLLLKSEDAAVKDHDVAHGGSRRDRWIAEHEHDPYKAQLKLPEPTVCPACGAAFAEGRWHWPAYPPMEANSQLCQACHRIRDNYPAGWLMLTGGFVKKHKQEIMQLARHNEQLENAEYPLHRIMAIEEQGDGLVITTTDIHLPRRIGEALKHAYHGQLEFHYEEEPYRLRVQWKHNGEA